MSDFDPKARQFFFRPTAVLKVTGDDAFPFLQGQFTQDLRGAKTAGQVAYGLWLNQKGKVLADSFVLHYAGDWLVVSLFSAAALIRERLEAYVIADDVVIDDETERWAGVSVLGAKAGERLLKSNGASHPPEGHFCAIDAGFIFPGRRTTEPNWEWLCPVAPETPGHRGLVGEAVVLDFAAMERFRIEAGIPSVPRDIGPEDLPNEGGLDQDAISYTKGCYLGQEVMARLKTMGQVRRRLMRIAGPSVPPEVLPAPLFAGGKKIGELRSAAPVDQGFAGLAMISLLGLTERPLLSFSSDKPGDVVITDVPL